jgi:hypothetical protein
VKVSIGGDIFTEPLRGDTFIDHQQWRSLGLTHVSVMVMLRG